jgi:predicted RNA-binding Zn-ribbon protein involved in translation (DUF1610 family)
MSKLTERAEFLRGLATGYQLDESKPEHSVILQLVDLIGDMAKELEETNEKLNQLQEYMEEIDIDLELLEDAVFEDEDEDFEEDYDAVEYECPHCGHPIHFNINEFDLDEDYHCPNCGNSLFPEDDEDDEDDEDESNE